MGQVGNKEIIGAQYRIPQFRLIISSALVRIHNSSRPNFHISNIENDVRIIDRIFFFLLFEILTNPYWKR